MQEIIASGLIESDLTACDLFVDCFSACLLREEEEGKFGFIFELMGKQVGNSGLSVIFGCVVNKVCGVSPSLWCLTQARFWAGAGMGFLLLNRVGGWLGPLFRLQNCTFYTLSFPLTWDFRHFLILSSCMYSTWRSVSSIPSACLPEGDITFSVPCSLSQARYPGSALQVSCPGYAGTPRAKASRDGELVV